MSRALWCLALVTLAWTEAGAQIAVVAHKSVAAEQVDLARLMDIYTLNSQQWKDGARIQVVDYKGAMPLKADFYKRLSTTPADMQKVWLRKQFSGKAIPPSTVKSEAELIEKVAATPGAIGYVSAGTEAQGVKVIATLP
jgi:ABC-type phosphate transport system substrate-binding protein